MLAKAKEKITSEHVQFIQADILQDWNFTNTKYDLVGFSLVLEHIENLKTLFDKVSNSVDRVGMFILANSILLNNIPEPKQASQQMKVNKLLPVSIITSHILLRRQSIIALLSCTSMNILMKMTAPQFQGY